MIDRRDGVSTSSTSVDSIGTGPSQPDVNCIPSQTVEATASVRRSRLLKFQASWYTNFPWLHYVPHLGGILCFVCAKADHLKLLQLYASDAMIHSLQKVSTIGRKVLKSFVNMNDQSVIQSQCLRLLSMRDRIRFPPS